MMRPACILPEKRRFYWLLGGFKNEGILEGRDPIRVQPNTSVVRAIDRGQWQAPLGSSRDEPPDRRQSAVVLASVKDKPAAALKKRRP